MSLTGQVWDGSSSPLLHAIQNVHTYLSTTLIPYTPFSLFAVIHCTRIACAYRGGARAGGFDDRLGNFQAALVPIMLVFGGTTITGMLMGNPPGWLISPVPFLTYGLLPLVAAKSGLVSALLTLPALPRELLFATVDGFSRITGITTFGVDTVLTHPHAGLRNSPWAMVLTALIAGGGGGMILPAIKGFHADWGFGTPPWVKDGPGVDIWGAGFIGFVYATLIDAHPAFRLLPNLITSYVPGASYFLNLPKGYLTNPSPHPLLPIGEAKIACSLVLASMLMTRVAYVPVKSWLATRPVVQKPDGSKTITAKPSKKSLREKKQQ